MDLSSRVEKEFLPFINKPGRFLGNEYNTVRKNPAEVKLRIALAFPDIYELGMSYVGYDILYHILNARPDLWAERVYAPWFDAEEVMRAKNIPLFSLESRTPLSQFDWIGFTLQYELTYSTLLNMLDLAGIPLRSADRDHRFPLVIAGGPSAYNPEPLAEFVDLFLLGDGEEAVLDICQIIIKAKEEGKNRQQLLHDLASITGIYVPAFYKVKYDAFGEFQSISPVHENFPKRIYKRILPDLTEKNYPMRPLVPLIEITHDRLAVEIMRGCSEGCRFCNAGMIYRPVRQRKVEDIIRQSQLAIRNSGFEEISLLSLNTSDYQDLNWLMVKEKMLSAEEKLSFSFPSLRLDGLTGEMVDFVQTFKKTGFTFAPEAGSQRLRNVINKNIREEDLLTTLRLVLQSGWKVVKFYFMIGLPTEKEQDLEAIVDLVQKGKKIAREFKDVRMNISISPFSPKPHTPFQWEKQDTPQEIERKSRYLVNHLENEQITVSWREGYASCLETIFTRGGRELAGVLEQAWVNGARFDGWHEGFRWTNWESAFKKCGIDWKKYLKPLSISLPLPWDHIDMGISKSFLQKEKLNAYEGRPTVDCRESVCLGCGLQRKEFEQLVSCFKKEEIKPLRAATDQRQESPVSPTNRSTFGRYSKKRVVPQQLAKKKIRVRYIKTGLTRFISHLDVVRLFDRAARRAKISLVYSQGFHPRPKLSFAPPLSLGVGSIAEYLDLEVEMGREDDFQFKLNQVLPAGMQIIMQKTIFSKVPSLASTIGQLTYETELENLLLPPEWLVDFLAQPNILVERQLKEGTKTVNIRPFIKKLEVTDHKLLMTIIAIEGRMAKVTEVLESLLGKQGLDYRNFYTQRTGQFIVSGDKIQDPFEVI
jgi:radical SAM family uncharacterized protein/radical SAM-linked protein